MNLPTLLFLIGTMYAVPPGRPVESLIERAETPARLRADLLAHAASDSSRAGAGAAWFHAGQSYEREGRGDSALICYQRAVELRGQAPEQDALVEALLSRNSGDDLERARRVLTSRLEVARRVSEVHIAEAEGRRAWSYFLEQKRDTAASLLAQQERYLLDAFLNPFHREWRYRMGAAELARGRPDRAFELLLPLAVESRLQDTDVMGMMQEAAKGHGSASGLRAIVQRPLAQADREDDLNRTELGGHRLSFRADDGYPLGAVWTAPKGRAKRRAIVALLSHAEPWTRYDSVAVALRRAGYALVLLDPRGSGRSVSQSCPLPESWRSREAEMHSRCARDVSLALRALADSTAVDTSEFFLMGSAETASIVVEAATRERRVRGLILWSPKPAPAVLGETRARLASLEIPVFIQTAVEDQASAFAESLFGATNQRISRLSESERFGRTAEVMRLDRGALARLSGWLAESWPKRAPRPASPRRG